MAQGLSPVIQEEATGCGIAAVANLLGKSYAQMRTLANGMDIYATDTALWSDTRYVRRLLGAFGVATSPTETPFTHWDALPDLALLPIKHHQHEGKEFWHWVVFKRVAGNALVLDSASYLADNCRTDFDQMHPRWFIAVNPAADQPG